MRKRLNQYFINIGRYLVNQRGMTLAELLIALVLLSVVLAVGYSFYSYGEHSFSTGESQSIVQRNARLAADFITREARYANELEILDDIDTIPNRVSNNDKYIFVDSDGLIKKLDKKGKDNVLGAVAQGVEFNLSFQRQGKAGNILDFNSETTDGKKNFSLDSQIEIMNLPESIGGKSSGEYIRYKISPDAKALTLFSFNGLSPAVVGFINEAMKTITVTVPKDTNVNDLVANFEFVGEKVMVGSVEQKSGTTKNDFSHPVIYTVVAENGSSVNYTVNVIFTEPPEAYVRIRVENDDSTILPCEDSNLIGSYDYFPNGSGEEGQSYSQWVLVNDDGSIEELTSIKQIKKDETDTFVPSGLAGRKVAFRVKPVSLSGIEGSEWFYSFPEMIYPAQNPFWRRFVSDTYYLSIVNSTEMTPEQIRQRLKDLGLEDYEVKIKLRDDYSVLSTTDPDTENLNLRVGAQNSDAVRNGGTHISIDVSDYVEDINSYTILVDAQVLSGSGYGILLNGYVDRSNGNKDQGYMFQFDPGANGFLIRKIGGKNQDKQKIDPGEHDPDDYWGLTSANKLYSMDDIENENFKFDDWYKRYTTEIKLQMRPDGDLVLRVHIIDQDGNRSNAMWFGHSGTYDTNGKKFTGSEMPKFFSQDGTSIGIRTWDKNGKGYDVMFQEISLEEGFKSIHISNAEYISDTEVKVNFEDEKGFATAVELGDKYRITIGGQSILKQTITEPTYTDLILTLKNTASQQELLNGANSEFLAGSIWMRWLKDIITIDDTNYRVKKDATKPRLVSVKAQNDNRQLVLSFSENLNATTANNRYNYRLSGRAVDSDYPDSVSANGNKVTLKIDGMNFKWGRSVTIDVANVTDKAGNIIDPNYDRVTHP